MARGKYRKKRDEVTTAFLRGISPHPSAEAMRGRVAWHMQVIDVRIGYEVLGFDYPMNGDERPGRSK